MPGLESLIREKKGHSKGANGPPIGQCKKRDRDSEKRRDELDWPT